MRGLIIALFLSAILMSAQAQVKNWSKRIVSKTETPLLRLINPHVDDNYILIIDGKRFDHVRGIKQFYLPVPETNAVVFVVDEKDYSVTYHFFNMDTDKDIAIHAGSSIFGNGIGGLRQEDSVSAVNQGVVTLTNRLLKNSQKV